ncbi:MAG: SDR family NAD(P)-dependent oxidoreductase, partial [Alphaproteobacteria bacterium]
MGFRLDGRKVLVIGGSAGMGLATAELAADHGADLAIAARNPGRLEAAAKALEARDLVATGQRITHAAAEQLPVVHPENPGIHTITFT